MAERFRACGLKADYLTADRDSERDTLKKQLSSGHINYLFVVDMFNEGIDIPAVDTVLFLRPTESPVIFMQQLGRGLRLYPGKQLLTVFDFVAQLNQKYDYASRFRNLLTHTESSIIEQVKMVSRFYPMAVPFTWRRKRSNMCLITLSGRYMTSGAWCAS